MQEAARTAYRFVVGLFFAGLFVQFFLAGLGLFRVRSAAGHRGVHTTKGFEDRFHAHMVAGTALVAVAVVLLVVALLARESRPRMILSGALVVLVLLQMPLANAGPTWFRALHVVNALLIVGLASELTHSAWRGARASTA